MNSFSIYLGPKVISIVEAKGKKIVHRLQIAQSTISSGDLEDKVPSDVKLIALLKDELRKNNINIEVKDATLCLSGRDLIVRNFEIPMMPREELQSAVNFEAKKYIPFKVEDLITDCQIGYDKSERTNLILFIGIKKDVIERYISLLQQLGIKLSAIEYSAFSLIRCLKLNNLSDSGIVGVLGADLQEEDEVNFSVLENGFPLFSRDIGLGSRPEAAQALTGADINTILEKLKTELRVSLDYYHRKFPNKNIKKIFFLSGEGYRSELETFIAEIGLPAQFIDLSALLAKDEAFSLSLIKAYSASLAKMIKTRIKVNLLAAKEKQAASKEKLEKIEGVSILEGIKIDFRFVALGVLICLASFGIGAYRIQPIKQELNKLMQVRPGLALVNAGATYAELTLIEEEYQKKLQGLEALIKKQVYYTEPLDAIPRAMPKGLWLNNLTSNEVEPGKVQLTMEGMVYLADSEKEFEALNDFLANLKATEGFSKYFTNINIVTINSQLFKQKITVTSFLVACKNFS